MTESAQVEPSGDGLVVDTTKQYKPSAGQCPQCGHYKTWDFKITNPKTGKGMPGHVTKEGFKIGDGNCPYWNNLQKLNAAKAEKKAQAATRQPPAPAGQAMQNVVTSMAPRQASQQAIPAEGFVLVTIGTMRVELARSEAVRIAKEIIDQLE
nr:hypothetical protein [Candidatus Sigynarchaeota archaeon]